MNLRLALSKFRLTVTRGVKLISAHGPALAALTFILITFFLYIYYPKDWPGSDLTSNLFAGAIDIIFTVIVLGWLLRRNEQKRTRPIRYSAYLAANSVMASFGSMWARGVAAASAETPPSETNIFAELCCDTLASHLHLGADAGVYPSRSWGVQLRETSQEIKSNIDTLIQRYQLVLDADLIDALRRFEHSHVLGSWDIAHMFTQLPFSQSVFIKKDVPTIMHLHRILDRLSMEFQAEADFHEPFHVGLLALAKEKYGETDILGSARK